jgi:membrane protein DedA with SNARE-associated domain
MSAVMTDGHAEAIGSFGMLADLPQLTTTMTSTGSNWWEYLLLFVAVMASWAGVPMIGSAAAGAAAVAASQGNLNLVAVITISILAGEAGGLIGYYVGHHWGSKILARPGKRQAGRQKADGQR